MKFQYVIEAIPGNECSRIVRQCEAHDSDHAWAIATKDARSVGPSARVNWVKDVLLVGHVAG